MGSPEEQGKGRGREQGKQLMSAVCEDKDCDSCSGRFYAKVGFKAKKVDCTCQCHSQKKKMKDHTQ
jgi:hypothetical protein